MCCNHSPAEFQTAFDEIIRFCDEEQNWPTIEDELSHRGVRAFAHVLLFSTSLDCKCKAEVAKRLNGQCYFKMIIDLSRKYFAEFYILVEAQNSLVCVVQVVDMNFFDIVIDFIFLDAFDDLESPPSSIVNVLQNRWLSQSFKETVLVQCILHPLEI